MLLPDDPEAVAAALPDVPRWVETRSLLRSGKGTLMIGGDGDGGVVMDTQLPSGAVIGRADPALLLDVLADVAGDFELIVQMDALTEAQEALPGWIVAQAILHSPAGRRSGSLPSSAFGFSPPGLATRRPRSTAEAARDGDVVPAKRLGSVE